MKIALFSPLSQGTVHMLVKRMDGWRDGSGWMDGWIRMDGWIQMDGSGWMDRWIRMDGWMDPFIHFYRWIWINGLGLIGMDDLIWNGHGWMI